MTSLFVTNYDLAKQRHDLLWSHYHLHGKIKVSEIRRLTGKDWQPIYATFETNGLEGPPIYDTHRAKLERKCKLLWDAVAELEQDHLTIVQAGRVLKEQPNKVYGILTQMNNHNLDIPDIIEIRRQVRNDPELPAEPQAKIRMNGWINIWHHPRGLQVLEVHEGPGPDELTYLLR